MKIEEDLEQQINSYMNVLSIILGIIVLGMLIFPLLPEKKKTNTVMSFKESLDLVDLPIVTFYQGDKKFNFLLDTGASQSVINKGALKLFDYKKIDEVNEAYGIDGNTIEVTNVKIELSYKGHSYEDIFIIYNMQDSIDNVKKESGVNFVGILGNSFFTKYNYILDFKELIAYQK